MQREVFFSILISSCLIITQAVTVKEIVNEATKLKGKGKTAFVEVKGHGSLFLVHAGYNEQNEEYENIFMNRDCDLIDLWDDDMCSPAKNVWPIDHTFFEKFYLKMREAVGARFYFFCFFYMLTFPLLKAECKMRTNVSRRRTNV